MKVQVRFINGSIQNEEIETVIDFVDKMEHSMNAGWAVGKMSFDFLDGARLVLYSNGEYQIFGGSVNYPPLTQHSDV